jgi:ABC-type amino acid transport substrate-binding protein
MHGLLLGLMLVLGCTPALAATLERIKGSGTLTIGYREDAAPYSYKDALGEPAGYSVELCRAVAAHLKQDLGLAEIAVQYVPVTAADRFAAVQEGRIDLLCGATTATLSRRALVDFSLPTFVDGASVLYRSDGPATFEALAGQKVGVHGATTTEQALRHTLQRLSLDAEVVTVDSHDEGLRRLEAGEIAAYFADRAILTFLAARSGSPEQLRLSDRYFTHEPYALALPRGDSDFRLAVDRALSRIYRSGAIGQIFTSAFGTGADPSELLQALFVISPLPE